MIIFNYKIDFKLKNEKEISNWISKVVKLEKKEIGEINYIFSDDEYMLNKNIKYLNHDTLTDIITFDYSNGNNLTSDIIISVERVKENAGIFKTNFLEELNRVIIHGILHLCGYDDKTEKLKIKMRQKEDIYLKLIK